MSPRVKDAAEHDRGIPNWPSNGAAAGPVREGTRARGGRFGDTLRIANPVQALRKYSDLDGPRLSGYCARDPLFSARTLAGFDEFHASPCAAAAQLGHRYEHARAQPYGCSAPVPGRMRLAPSGRPNSSAESAGPAAAGPGSIAAPNGTANNCSPGRVHPREVSVLKSCRRRRRPLRR